MISQTNLNKLLSLGEIEEFTLVLSESLLAKSLTDMTKVELGNIEVARKLFDFYDEIKIIGEFSPEQLKFIHEQLTRHLIVIVLGKGIQDVYPGTNIVRTRRALSGKEIITNLNKMIKEDYSGKFPGIQNVKKSNVFFHLRKLEEAGFVQEVGIIKSGRRHTSYFGRTAVIFIAPGRQSEFRYKLFGDENFIAFIGKLNPDVSLSTIKAAISSLQPLNQSDSGYFIDWIKKYEEEFKEFEIDYIEL
ncbi:MAG: hypothetical protein ACXAD7_26435, partial [Candidatus Kariarchaeaceae archaeon]